MKEYPANISLKYLKTKRTAWKKERFEFEKLNETRIDKRIYIFKACGA